MFDFSRSLAQLERAPGRVAVSQPQRLAKLLLGAEPGYQFLEFIGYPGKLVDRPQCTGSTFSCLNGCLGNPFDVESYVAAASRNFGDVTADLGSSGGLLLHGGRDRRLRVVDLADYTCDPGDCLAHVPRRRSDGRNVGIDADYGLRSLLSKGLDLAGDDGKAATRLASAAASIVVFRARRFVWPAIFAIILATSAIALEVSISSRTVVVAVFACAVASPAMRAASEALRESR